MQFNFIFANTVIMTLDLIKSQIEIKPEKISIQQNAMENPLMQLKSASKLSHHTFIHIRKVT